MSGASEQAVKISAILPNYNMANTLTLAIKSLLDQTKPFTEIIVVDDGSTDNSVHVINDMITQHPQVKLIRHDKNQGVLAALNTGIQAAQGDYVMLCAADDVYGDKIVEASLPVIQHHPQVGVICGNAIVNRFDLSSNFFRMLPFPVGRYIPPAEFRTIAKKSYVGFNGGGGMLINTRMIVEAGFLQEASRWHGDWILYFVAAFRQGIYYVNEVFTYINIRQTAYSSGKNDMVTQDRVMLDTVHILKQKYPDCWQDFRDAALMPHYSIRYIKLFLTDPIARQFVTLKLIWKMFINNSMVVRIGRLFPYRIILGMRKLLRA